MSEYVGAAIAIIGFIGTVFNVYLTARIRADISELKVWALTSFATKAELDTSKADMRMTVQTYLSQERTRPVTA